ncbi:hypothetical protein LBMAG53_23120 [Planctomycetota bacterium]|nr:hypothetical protein LBMAG53_23120 [Planctomycetota bacterium]
MVERVERLGRERVMADGGGLRVADPAGECPAQAEGEEGGNPAQGGFQILSQLIGTARVG